MSASVLFLFVAGMVGSHPAMSLATQDVDLIEINHLYDEQGQHLLDQLIFYEWSAHRGRYDVLAWRKLKSTTSTPQRSWQDGGYHLTWYDRGLMRHVRADAIRETWTQYDPEVLERQALPVERRRELRTPPMPQGIDSAAVRETPATADRP